MALLVYKDRVKETTTTTGTGAVTLAGAVTGYQAWTSIGDGNTAYYFIEGIDANGVPNGIWEVGIGLYTLSGTTVTRLTILASSNAGSVVSLTAGTYNVVVTFPAQAATVPGAVVAVATSQTLSFQ